MSVARDKGKLQFLSLIAFFAEQLTDGLRFINLIDLNHVLNFNIAFFLHVFKFSPAHFKLVCDSY